MIEPEEQEPLWTTGLSINFLIYHIIKSGKREDITRLGWIFNGALIRRSKSTKELGLDVTFQFFLFGLNKRSLLMLLLSKRELLYLIKA